MGLRQATWPEVNAWIARLRPDIAPWELALVRDVEREFVRVYAARNRSHSEVASG